MTQNNYPIGYADMEKITQDYAVEMIARNVSPMRAEYLNNAVTHFVEDLGAGELLDKIHEIVMTPDITMPEIVGKGFTLIFEFGLAVAASVGITIEYEIDEIELLRILTAINKIGEYADRTLMLNAADAPDGIISMYQMVSVIDPEITEDVFLEYVSNVSAETIANITESLGEFDDLEPLELEPMDSDMALYLNIIDEASKYAVYLPEDHPFFNYLKLPPKSYPLNMEYHSDAVFDLISEEEDINVMAALVLTLSELLGEDDEVDNIAYIIENLMLDPTVEVTIAPILVKLATLANVGE